MVLCMCTDCGLSFGCKSWDSIENCSLCDEIPSDANFKFA